MTDERGRIFEAVERDRDGWILRMYSCRQRDGRVNTYVSEGRIFATTIRSSFE
jgi:hypothetical protein